MHQRGCGGTLETVTHHINPTTTQVVAICRHPDGTIHHYHAIPTPEEAAYVSAVTTNRYYHLHRLTRTTKQHDTKLTPMTDSLAKSQSIPSTIHSITTKLHKHHNS